MRHIYRMCTVTWHRADPGYELFFNRDELRTRLEAEPPRRREARAADGGTVAFLAPADGDHGGTWIAVNEHGVTVGIVNGYRTADAAAPPDVRSRGLLVSDLAPARTVREVEEALRATDPARYRSFRLLAIAPDEPLMTAEWDRVALAVDRDAEERIPLISSAVEETDVGAKRRREYARAVGPRPDADRLAAYHRSHANGPSAYSVCMHRPEAATRSFTRVRVDADRVAMIYHPGTPCEPARETEATLARAGSP